MRTTYNTKGVCSKKIELDIENGIIKSVSFLGGCEGNAKGISRLIRGMRADEAIERLSGIRCGRKQTSCPDQLSLALKEALEKD